jgi:hypothetical protein
MMENRTKYYVTAAGAYLGGYETNPPEGAIEVPFAPDHAGQIWNGNGWGTIPVTPREVHAAWFKKALLEMGQLERVDTFVAALPRDMSLLWEYATSFKEDDADVVGIARALSIDLKAVFDTAETLRKARFGG